jgi:hypothetical protein
MNDKKLLELGFELVVSVALGLVTTFWVSGSEAFLIGLGAFFCIEIVRMRSAVEKSSSIADRVTRWLELLRPNDSVAELAMLYGLKKITQLSVDSVYVDRSLAWHFWRQCMLRATTRWAVLNYSIPDEGWTLAWGDAALALQQERVSNGCRVQRVFIVESEEELEDLQRIMSRQATIGVEVAYLFKKDLFTLPKARELAEAIGTLDFAVVDNSWTFISNLDSRRRVIRVGATSDSSTLTQAIALFDETMRLATKVDNPINTTNSNT